MKVSRSMIEKYIEGASDFFIGARRGSQKEDRGYWRLPEYGLASTVVAQGIMDVFVKGTSIPEKNKSVILQNLSPWCKVLGLPSDFAEKTVQEIMKYKLKEN